MKFDLELINLEADIQSLNDKLTDDLRSLEIVSAQLREVGDLVHKVRIAGFNNHTEDMIRACEAFAAHSSLGIEKTLKYKSLESLGESIRNGLIKFFEALREIVMKVFEMVKNLIDATGPKAAKIIAYRQAYKPSMTNVVSLPDPATFKELSDLFDAASKVCDKYVYIMNDAGKAASNMLNDPEFTRIIGDKNMLVMSDRGNVSLNLDWYSSKIIHGKTAEECGYTTTDVVKICSDYLKQNKSFTTFGSTINKLINSLVHKLRTSIDISERYYDGTSVDRDGYVKESEKKRPWTSEELEEERKEYIAYTSLYRCCALIQKEKSRVISEFYKAIPEK